MCTPVIIDTNVLGDFCRQETPAYKELDSWLLQGHGSVLYTTSGRYGRELDAVERMSDFLTEYRRAQVLVNIAARSLDEIADKVDELNVRSNDHHILALALVGKAGILCSKDMKLREDFKKLLPKVEGQRHARAIYPVEAKTKKHHRRFLEDRKCRKR